MNKRRQRKKSPQLYEIENIGFLRESKQKELASKYIKAIKRKLLRIKREVNKGTVMGFIYEEAQLLGTELFDSEELSKEKRLEIERELMKYNFIKPRFFPEFCGFIYSMVSSYYEGKGISKITAQNAIDYFHDKIRAEKKSKFKNEVDEKRSEARIQMWRDAVKFFFNNFEKFSN